MWTSPFPFIRRIHYFKISWEHLNANLVKKATWVWEALQPQPKPELSSLITMFLKRNLNLWPSPPQPPQAFNKVWFPEETLFPFLPVFLHFWQALVTILEEAAYKVAHVAAPGGNGGTFLFTVMKMRRMSGGEGGGVCMCICVWAVLALLE